MASLQYDPHFGGVALFARDALDQLVDGARGVLRPGHVEHAVAGRPWATR